MIGLVDCNNFFVSCERLFRPDLLRKPVAVLSSNDGCIVARSNEVKALGIPMGVPLFEVKDIVEKHSIVLFSSNFTLYRDISARVMSALKEECDSVSVYSIDEAFCVFDDSTPLRAIEAIRERIIQNTGIPVSIGLGSTRTRAKLASTFAKKGSGVFHLTDSLITEHAPTIPVGTVWGIGRQMSVRCTTDGVTTVHDFLARGMAYARLTFGVHGERIFHELSGKGAYTQEEGEGEVHASIASTRSFPRPLHDHHAIMGAIAYHIAHLGEKLREREQVASTLTILAYPGRQYGSHPGSAHMVLPTPTDSTEALLGYAQELFDTLHDHAVPYKKAGAVVSGIIPLAYVSPSILTGVSREKSSLVYDIVDSLNRRYGGGTLYPGLVHSESAWEARSDMRSPRYTTAWSEIPSVKAI